MLLRRCLLKSFLLYGYQDLYSTLLGFVHLLSNMYTLEEL